MFLRKTNHVTQIRDLPVVCAEMGWEQLKTVQLDPGADLRVRTDFVANHSYAMVAFDPNKRIYVTGERHPDYQTFCVVDQPASSQNEQDYIDHGHYLNYSALGGMQASKTYASFQVGPSGRMIVAAIPWKVLSKWTGLLDRFGSDTTHLMSKACQVNKVLLHPLWYERLRSAMVRRVYNPTPDVDGTDIDQLLCLIVQATLCGKEVSVKHPDSIRLTKAIIDLAYADISLQPAKLTDLAKLLHADTRTLQHDTKRQVGMGPMELLKLVRMQQVRRVLTDKAAAQQFAETYKFTGITPIPSVFGHYGLNYNSNAIKSYKHFYGNSPKQDQKTCAA